MIRENETNNISIFTDPNRVRQVLSNLLGNALKFTKTGFIEFGYTLKGNKTIRFFVRDTGVGIPKEKFDLVFDRFRQIDDTVTKAERGAGLGLTISKSLVELLGGKIWVESELGVGSTFYFELPYISSHKLHPEPIVKPGVKESYNWKGKSVLVVEDEDINYKFIKEFLTKTQIDIIRAKDGVSALEHCRHKKEIDIVLLDIQLPKMDGYEFMRHLKKVRKDLPVVVQTAYAMADEKINCFNAGCNEYFSKPLDIYKVLRTLNKYLGEK